MEKTEFHGQVVDTINDGLIKIKEAIDEQKYYQARVIMDAMRELLVLLWKV